MQEVSGYGTKELNLNGKVVVPGFIDSHVHLLPGGLQVLQCFSVYIRLLIEKYFLLTFLILFTIWVMLTDETDGAGGSARREHKRWLH